MENSTKHETSRQSQKRLLPSSQKFPSGLRDQAAKLTAWPRGFWMGLNFEPAPDDAPLSGVFEFPRLP
jgi:hypothetical protein